MARNKSEKEIEAEGLGEAFKRLQRRSRDLSARQNKIAETAVDNILANQNAMMGMVTGMLSAWAGQMAYEKGLEIEVTDGEK